MVYLHPCFHGFHHERGKGGVEVHLEGKCLGAESVEGAGVVITGSNVQPIVTSGTSSSTLWEIIIIILRVSLK